MHLTISGYSTALFSTWYFIEELKILFDAGDGVTASLLQKSRKINHVFISHADRDHLTGLQQLSQLNAREGAPTIYFPRDCGSFEALENFTKKFDPHVSGTTWQKLVPNQIVPVKEDMEVEAFRNNHVQTKDDVSKSLSYKVYNVKSKLKKEFATLSPEQIRALTIEKGKEFTTEKIKTNILSYSGDTPVEDYSIWDNSTILIHEATFINEADAAKAHGNRHSTLEQVMKMVSEIKIETLILGHFSSRYSANEIDDTIKKLYQHYGLHIPVFRVLPGETSFDILKSPPVCGG